MGRILSLDLGEKRIGFALSDPGRIIASPAGMIRFDNKASLFLEIEKIIDEKNVDLLVIGMPIREDGREGTGCAFSREVADYFIGKKMKTVLWDERYSSRTAEKVLRECHTRKNKIKLKIDSLAAAVILEDYMKHMSKP
ncbi:MAG: Holliday junction resolvase RuvX [Spirochaetales bacterium]|nr:Holliday junction resolvase RuvX [Spirochaetales bacterium]